VKRLLLLFIPLIAMTSACTPRQAAAWRAWHSADPVEAEAFLASDAFSEISQPAQASAQAERLDPPSSGGSSASSNGRCVGYEGLLAQYSPGWSVERMSRIMYRESRCNPGAYNPSGATGLLQVLKSHCGWLAPRVGPCNLTNASYNIRASAELYRNGGSDHWAMTR
jgi:hypothetical protein